MSELIDIKADKFKNYIVSYKACALSVSGCKLLPKFGKVIFNFSSFYNIERCVLHLKKNGGNGALTFISPKIGDINIMSKSVQAAEIKPGKDGLVHIIRPNYGTGDIDIIGISLYVGEDKREPVDMPNTNWKHVISRCNGHKGLRLIRGKLFASEGGFIDGGGKITLCQTEPPNFFSNKGTRIVFKGSCRILKIEFKEIKKLDSNEFKQNDEKLEFVHLNEPSPVAVKEYREDNINTELQDRINCDFIPRDIEEIKNIIDNKDNVALDNILYDSVYMRGFDAVKVLRNSLVKYINSNGQDYVLLKNEGSFDLPISSLEPNRNYICIVNCKKYNGNGKLFLQFVDNTSVSEQHKLILTTNLTNQYVKITTSKSVRYGDFYKLRISSIKGISSGDFLIGRIIILEDLDINPLKTTYDSSSDISYNKSIVSCDINNDNLYKIAKVFAIHKINEFKEEGFYDISGEISSNTVSGMNYLNKIKGLFPNIKFTNTFNKKGLLISEVGNLRKADRIWVDVFTKIGDSDINILKDTNIIFTPSMSNQQYLSEHCGSSKIIYKGLSLPYVKSKIVKYLQGKNYVLMFNRSNDITRYVVNNWKSNLPSVVLIGARGRYPKTVIPLNEYLPYDELIFAILNSKCVLDFPEQEEYSSSFLSFASNQGIPIISSNWFVINLENGYYLNRSENVNNLSVPSIENIFNAVRSVKSDTNVISNNNNDAVKDTIISLLNE